MVLWTRNGAKLCDRPPCALGMPRAQPLAKMSARRPPSQNRPAERAKTGGGLKPWWGGGAKLVSRTRNGAKLCDRPSFARGMPRAQPRPKTSAPTTPSQNRPAEKGQNGGCAIALVGVGRSWSAGLGMGPNFATGLRVPLGCPGHSRAQKRAPLLPRPKTAQRKRAKTGGVL